MTAAASDNWYQIATTDEVEEEGSFVIEEIRGREIALFNVEGSYRAILNYCVHQGGPLCEGGLTERLVLAEDGWGWEYDGSKKVVRCPWHNWAFDIDTGTNLNDEQYAVPTYDIDVQGDDIFVRL